MAKSVDLARLAELLPGYGFAFLVTVGDDYRVRTTAITPTFDGTRVDIGAVGSHGRENIAARAGVTLVWPAREVDESVPCGWHLIVERLTERGELERYEELVEANDWRTARDGGPRSVLREDLT